ncbi:MAG: hypothetical protein L0387_04530 [Acidobacteria bacterium]|nr:hypothetical protein [Acidobacteriota bacterium]MCI0723586.1 hypothetical protein [Acidobacteriota bacterium]
MAHERPTASTPGILHTLLSTTKKLGVSFYQYVQDRVTGVNQVPSLAELIQQKAQALNLGASWNSS